MLEEKGGKNPRRPAPAPSSILPRPSASPAGGDSLHPMLMIEEKESDFTSIENARRACATINTAALTGNEAFINRSRAIVSTWLARGESEWIDEIHTTVLFDITLEVIKALNGAYMSKNVKERVVKAFINRLRAARKAVEWLGWLRFALGRGDLLLIDVRPQLEPLLQVVVSLVSKTRHAVAVAPRGSSIKKLHELWTAHAEISTEVGELLMRTPDGLAPLLMA
ncbi:MAG TPA: hypothetical protein VEF04_11085, partial [Blastocatellia bacterium]|nr:hypothetical protein [Blastocatellia bacterium]